ncbi:cellulose synthase-like protein D4 isoform X1 [Physcomitrium patens]|uniref:Uncharacterized protein n=1 Tax=Physcomitrium patens TaxID=3218 RepID=A0A7I3ZRM2_PHYPA
MRIGADKIYRTCGAQFQRFGSKELDCLTIKGDTKACSHGFTKVCYNRWTWVLQCRTISWRADDRSHKLGQPKWCGRNHHHARRTSRGRFNNLLRDMSEMEGATDNELGSDHLYTVQIPATPDHPMSGDRPVPGKGKQLGGVRGPTCAVINCDGKAMRDERGEDMTPCDCNFKICRDCYIDALNGSGKCPGCKDDYTASDEPGLGFRV